MMKSLLSQATEISPGTAVSPLQCPVGDSGGGFLPYTHLKGLTLELRTSIEALSCLTTLNHRRAINTYLVTHILKMMTDCS